MKMKKLLVLFIVVAFAAVGSIAIAGQVIPPSNVIVVASADTGPDAVVYDKAKNGVVNFDHKGHASKMDCKTCHGDAAPAKIMIDKKSAHGEACKDCHKSTSGPTGCKDCHVKQ